MDRFELHRRFIREDWPAKLTPTEALVWLAMWDYANTAGEAWPAVSTLARHLGHKSPSEVKRARSELISLGLLSVVSPGGGTKTAKFEIHIPGGKNPPGGKNTPGGELLEPGGKNPTTTRREIPAAPGGKNPPQTEQRTEQENKPKKGEPAPFDLGLLRDDLQASQLVELVETWLAENPQKPGQLKSNLRKLQNMSEAEAMACVDYSLSAGYKALYPDWNKKNEPKHKSARRDGCHDEPASNIRRFV